MSEHNEKRYGDTTECSKCGKQWDTNDPYPPPCKQPKDWLKEMRKNLRTKQNEQL